MLGCYVGVLCRGAMSGCYVGVLCWGAMLRCYVEGSLLLLVSYIVEELWIITSYLVGKMSLMNEVAFSLNTANHYHL